MKRYTPLTTTALLSALSVILTRFGSFRVPMGGAEGIRIGFGSLPNVLAGMIFGPIYGGVSAGVADIVGMIVSPMGAFMPQFTLTAVLGGAIPGLMFRIFKQNPRKEPGLFWLGLCIATGTVLISCGLTPYFIHTLFGLDFKTIIVPRILTAIFEIPIYAIVAKTIMKRLYGRLSGYR